MIAWCLLIKLQFLSDLFTPMTIWKMLPTWKDRSTQQQGLQNLVSAERSAMLIRVSWSLMQLGQFCSIPEWPHKKEPKEVSEISSDYLLNDHHWGILVLVLSVKLMGVQYSTPALSCRKENIFGEHHLDPEGTASMFGKDHLLAAHEQAWPDMACCDWHPSTLLYFSSCKTLMCLCT